MSVPDPRRAVQAAAVAAVGVPCALLGHLLATGVPAGAAATALAVAAVLAVAVAMPARTVPGLALVTGATQLAAHTVLAVLPTAGPNEAPACIPAVGRAASLGLQLAVLRADGACPAGSLALGATTSAALAAVGTALVILAGNAAVAVVTGVLVGRALGAGELLPALAGALRTVLGRTAARLARAAVPPPVPASSRLLRPRTARDRQSPAPRWVPGTVVLRGPPAGPAPAL